MKKITYKTCPYCKKLFESTNPKQVYCSVNCRVNANRHAKEEEVKCRYCGKIFFRKRGNKIKQCCSNYCQTELRREQIRNASHFYQMKNKENNRKFKPKLGTGSLGHKREDTEEEELKRIQKEMKRFNLKERF